MARGHALFFYLKASVCTRKKISKKVPQHLARALLGKYGIDQGKKGSISNKCTLGNAQRLALMEAHAFFRD